MHLKHLISVGDFFVLTGAGQFQVIVSLFFPKVKGDPGG
jgi:hypothetical protein